MVPRRALALSLALSLALGVAPARAADPAPRTDPARLDAVLLADGTLIRGTVVEYLPDRSVTIRSAADGQTLRFPWAEIASTILAPPVAPPPPQIVGEPDAPRVRVELATPARVYLHEILREPAPPRSARAWSWVEQSRYRIRCLAPCDTVVDGRHGRRFFLAGDDIPRSRTFSLAGLGPDVRAVVRPGHTMRLTAGLIGVPLGVAGVVVGGIFSADRDDQGWPPPAGIVLLSVGAALLVGGIVMLVTGRTRLTLTPGAPRSRPPPTTTAPITLR